MAVAVQALELSVFFARFEQVHQLPFFELLYEAHA